MKVLAPRALRTVTSKAQKQEVTEERKRSGENSSKGIALMYTFGFLMEGGCDFLAKRMKND